MIERLVSTLRDLAALSPTAMMTDVADRLRADCADAVRLELDCPQQSLTTAQRLALLRLNDALEGGASPETLLDAARRAGAAIGIVPTTPRSDRGGT
jgi:hypothetical protein